MLTKKKAADHIWIINSDKQEELGKAFIRFQEYYENADLKGRKNLSVYEIHKWWKTTREKGCKDSYYVFWTGFNLPGRIFLELAVSPEFRSGFSLRKFLKNPLWYPRHHKQEDELLALLSDLTLDEIATGYFIGVSKDSTQVLDHEMAHGFYTTNASYRSQQLHNIAGLPSDIYKRIHADLLSVGYHPNVIHDEIQAYLSTYVDTLPDTFDTNDYTQYTLPFVATFQSFNYEGFEV